MHYHAFFMFAGHGKRVDLLMLLIVLSHEL
jgi:hypothetical protein